jgi:hypothetical protein
MAEQQQRTRQYLSPADAGRSHSSLSMTSPATAASTTLPLSIFSTPRTRPRSSLLAYPQPKWTSSAANLLLSTLGSSGGLEKQAAESSHFVIVAVDFGTTYSGYAFCFKHKPNDIHVMHKWPGKL